MIEIALERLRRSKTRSTSEKRVHGQWRLHIWTAELCDGTFPKSPPRPIDNNTLSAQTRPAQTSFFSPDAEIIIQPKAITWNVVALFRKGLGPGQLVVPPKIRVRDSLRFRKSAFP
jgi:hypothetical protein